ncbi:hypothetical protein GKZ89_15415 [Bacillus mangrovi]|uniref:Uncharacterized protein n=1 Tax=Metabacillus mangrovi TaxID=1491830 RepID=A0A7X2V5G5_9BACI|nr:hypothetical protein [Metabacillus mangrovi]MTH54792.1 hypothetical protein [Metabacillus mangrovi]
MKKYWKLSLIVLVAAAGIGSFYIQKALSKSSLPEFTLQQEKGEGGSPKLTLVGSYEERSTLAQSEYSYEPVNITLSGSRYKNSLSYIQQQESNWFSYPDYDNLQRKHRDFMRGVKWEGGVFENEKWLVSVQPANSPEQWSTFSFKVADKKTKKQMEFLADIPNKRNSWIDIHDVQRIGNEVKVLAEKLGEDEQLVLYTFSLQSQKLIREKSFELKEKDQNISSRFNFYDKQYQTGPEKEAVYEVEFFEEVQKQEGHWEEVTASKVLFIINLESETAESVKLNSESETMNYYGAGSENLYQAAYVNGRITVSEIDSKTQKTDILTEIKAAEASQAAAFKDDVLFVVYSRSVKGYNVNSGKEVYSYKIAHKPLEKGARLSINTIHIAD